MKTYACAECGARLGEVRDGFAAISTRFPDDLLGCYSLLKRGPGAAICPRCSNMNVLAVPSIVVDSDHCAVIGLPEQIARADMPDEVLRHLAAQTGARKVAVAASPREFRRALISAYIAPAGNLLNSYRIADDRFAWLKCHDQELDKNFFAAMWLVSAGAVQLFTQPIDAGTQPPSSFVPHEHAPDAADHIVLRQEALRQHERDLGNLIGHLLLLWTSRVFEAQSFQPFAERVMTLIPRGTIDQDTLEASAAVIGRRVDAIDADQKGWITIAYLCEAVLALLALEHGIENPRKREWTGIAFFYDFMRRRDGNDERILLDAAQIRASIDQPMFWRTCRELATQFNLTVLTPENAKEFDFLYESAARVFPEEARAQMPLAVATSEGEKVVENSVRLILRQLKEGNDSIVAAVLNGLRTRHPAELPLVAHALLIEVGKNLTLGAERRCELLRVLIEMLNLTGHHQDARDVAEESARFMDSPEAAEISPEQRARLFNEIGNRMRYDGELDDALAMYEHALDLLGRDVHQKNIRVALRNRAIILRELHRYSEARAAFAALMPHADMTESRGLVTSQATCLIEMGLDTEALTLIESQFALVEGMSPDSTGVIEQVTLHASLLVQQNQVERARQMLDAIREPARQRNFAITEIVDHFATLRGAHATAPADKAHAIEALYDLFARLRPSQPLNRDALDAVAELNTAMSDAGRGKEAEALIRALCDQITPATAPSGWRLHLLAACHSALASDLDREGDDLLAALRHFELGLWNIAARDDVLAFTSPHAAQAMALVRQVVRRHERGNDPSAQLVRYAADVRAAPVLSSRLRHIADLQPPLTDLAAEDARLLQLLRQTPAVLLQFAATGEGVLAVRTWLSGAGAIESAVRHLGIDQDAFARVGTRLSFALLTAPPSAPELNMKKVRGWTDIAAALRAAMSDLPENLPLVIVAGPLREPVISLALGNARPICFVPSISALISMRKRHETATAAAAGANAPQRLFAFATWFDREREEEARALAGGVFAATEIAERNGLLASSVSDTAATSEQLLAGLSAADVAWIACHGRLRPGDDGVELYVSAHGSLPPADASSIRENLRDPHIVRWSQLAQVDSASRTVFSSACDSGLAFTNPGGERLGIERPLFLAGTSTFIAPMWPVPTVAAQRILAAILDRWLKNPKVPLVEHVWRARNASEAAGEPALANAAFAPFGDALTAM